MPLHRGAHPQRDEHSEERLRLAVNPFYGEADPVGGDDRPPRPSTGCRTGRCRRSTAYQLVHDELMLDGNSRLNLATFVTTWMEPQAGVLMAECRDKNMIDKDEYPRTAELERRCVAMLADLWNAPDPATAVGCSTTGSSEACMLAGLALKRRWAQAERGPLPGDRPAQPGHGRQRPGLLGEVLQLLGGRGRGRCRWRATGSTSTRRPPPSCATRTPSGSSASSAPPSTGRTSRSPSSARPWTPSRSAPGLDIPVHVDGASGAMVAPFLDADLVWDFRLPRVASINTSGHKYGLVYPGVGWALWRDAGRAARGAGLPGQLPGRRHADLRAELLPARAPRWSRSTTRSCGWAGTATGPSSRPPGTWPAALAERIEELGDFRLLTRGDELPVFAFTTDAGRHTRTTSSTSPGGCASTAGWCPRTPSRPNRQDLSVLRVVCRNGFSADLAELLHRGPEAAAARTAAQKHPLSHDRGVATAFHH